MQRFVAAEAVQKKKKGRAGLVVKSAESVNPADIPETSFHRCSGFTDSMQLPRLFTPRSKRESKRKTEREKGERES